MRGFSIEQLAPTIYTLGVQITSSDAELWALELTMVGCKFDYDALQLVSSGMLNYTHIFIGTRGQVKSIGATYALNVRNVYCV